MSGDEGRKPRHVEEPRFRILAVCAGNVCRSPAMERLVRAALSDDGSVEISSAGTHALVGHPIAEPMARLLAHHGADPGNFTARQFIPAMAAEADLVVTMSRELRSAAVTAQPRALRRTFTLRELAALAAALDPGEIEAHATSSSAGARLRALVPLAVSRRGAVRRQAREDDVVDPWRRSAAVYRESLQQITAALDVLLPAVTGSGGRTPAS